MVTREELQKRLWPDAFVDVDHNLNTAINKIREVLDDSAESPRFVETLPRRGYRFIGELEAPVQPVSGAVIVRLTTVEPARASGSRRKWFKVAAGALSLSALALATVVAYRWHHEQRPQEQAARQPFRYGSVEEANSPAFSPDGSRIAFAWNGEPARGIRGFDLYVKALEAKLFCGLRSIRRSRSVLYGPPTARRSHFNACPAMTAESTLSRRLGGSERKLHATRMPSTNFNVYSSHSLAIGWSLDGKWIAFADVAPGEE